MCIRDSLANLPQSVKDVFGPNSSSFDTSFTEWVDQLPGMSAYDTFARAAYANHDDCVEIPQYPSGVDTAPSEPNMYSDGSLTLPTK
eukprot:3983436-Karenia_brevis.AAC.1